MIVAARAKAPVSTCHIHVLHRDKRYDPDDRYYAGTGASAHSYRPLQEFYGGGTLVLEGSILTNAEAAISRHLHDKVIEYDRELSTHYEESVLENLSFYEDVYSQSLEQDVYALILPAFGTVDAELIEYLTKHPESLQSMDWRRFEQLLSAIFVNQGFRVELGPGRADGGIDLRLLHKDSIGTMLTLVQAKRYRQDRKITLEAVSSLKAIVHAHEANRGAFVTTSDFLPGARHWAMEHARELILVNGVDVLSWIRNMKIGRREDA